MATIDDIVALPTEVLETQDTVVIAAALPPVVTLQPTEIGNGLVLATIGLVSGNALLDSIAAIPDFRHVKPLLDQGRLDVSSPLVRGALDGLVVGNVITQAESDAIKALAEISTPVDEMTVRKLCWSDAGEWLV